MPSSHDLQMVRQIPPTVLAVDSGHLICRGQRDVRPRRYHVAKAAATLVRQVASPSIDDQGSSQRRGQNLQSQDIQDAMILANAVDGELEPLFGYLPDFPSVTVSMNMLPVLLTNIRAIDRPTIVAVLGEGVAPHNDTHADFAKSLRNFNRTAEEEIVQRLIAQAKAVLDLRQGSIGSRHDALTLQERPGKALLLNLWEPTLKAAIKRWQHDLSRDQSRDANDNHKTQAAATACLDGWGLGAVVLRRDGSSMQRRFQMASVELRFPSQRLDLNTISLLAQVADGWLQEIKAPRLQDLERVTLSIPSPIITAHVKQGFMEYSNGKLGEQVFAFPDLLWGWHPVLTFIEFLTRSELPSLFINTSRFPLVNLVALWPV